MRIVILIYIYNSSYFLFLNLIDLLIYSQNKYRTKVIRKINTYTYEHTNDLRLEKDIL